MDAIVTLRDPVNKQELQSFIGAANFYNRFIPNYASIIEPLWRLLHKDQCWTWGDDQSKVIQLIKNKLTSAPILLAFDPSGQTYITCDASAVAIGAVLSQTKDVFQHPVTFVSRVLLLAEHNYSVGEREALLVVCAMEKRHLYTYGRLVTVHTDHKMLTMLLIAGSSGIKPLRILHWTEQLRAYPQMAMKYIPSNQNHMADMLSQFVTNTPAQTAGNTKCMEPDVQVVLMTHLIPIITQEEVKCLNLADPILQQVRHFIVNGWPTKIQMGKEIQPYFCVKNELFVWSDCCVRRGNRVVIPTSLRQCILQLAHRGHHGIVHTKQTCRSSVWWPGVDSDVEHFVHNCDACTLLGKSIRPQQPLQQITDTLPGPWHSLQLDICGNFRAASHHQHYAIVLIDKYSK